MVIEKVFGLQSTSISLNKRFTILAEKNHFNHNVIRQRRRSGYLNRNVIDALLQRLGLENQMYTPPVQTRLSLPRGNLRRFGSEGNLPGMWRSNSFGNLSQSSQRANVKSRLSWTQSNGNLHRSASFGNLSGTGSMRSWRSYNQRRNRGRIQSQRNTFTRGGWAQGWGSRGGQQGQQRQQAQQRLQGLQLQQGQRRQHGLGGRGRGQSVDRGKGRVQRKQQQPKQLPTKEELDDQLDQYMACTKFALDKELEDYMTAGEMGITMDID